MAITSIRGKQVVDGSIQRADLDTTTVGQAVAAKIVQGSNISLSSTGADAGTGDVTVSAPVATASAAGVVPTPPNNTTTYLRGDATFATLATDIQPTIWSMRLRSFNAIGNPTFEVDQRLAGGTAPLLGPTSIDRWMPYKVGSTFTGTWQQIAASPPVLVPGTNFAISRSFLRIVLTGQQATMAAGDSIQLLHYPEGPQWRELSSDVHSVLLLVRSTVAGLSFGLFIKDPATATKSLTKLCTISSANTWTLIPLPNLPVWPSGNFVITPGSNGYQFGICLAAGTSLISPANDTWQNGNFVGAVGQSNFAASPVNSTFDIAFIQHEPGSICTTLIDCPFTQNLDDCLRYFSKSYSYSVLAGTNTAAGAAWGRSQALATTPRTNVRFPKPMAKVPTVSLYSTAGGAAGNVWNDGSASTVAATAASIGDGGFLSMSIPSGYTATQDVVFEWTADTGW